MRWMRLVLLISTAAALHCAPVAVNRERSSFLYNSIVFDIAYVGSAVPITRSLNDFQQSLEDYGLCEAKSVRFNVRRATKLDKNIIWNVPLLTAFEGLNEGRPSSSPRVRNLRVFISFVRGVFFPPPTPGHIVCGCTYGEASVSALVDQYYREGQELALLLHEFGHVIDLPGVDHCEDSRCLMFEFVRRNGDRFCNKCIDRIESLHQSN